MQLLTTVGGGRSRARVTEPPSPVPQLDGARTMTMDRSHKSTGHHCTERHQENVVIFHLWMNSVTHVGELPKQTK